MKKILFVSIICAMLWIGCTSDKDYKLYAIYGSGSLASTPWPMFHHDLKHTGRVGVDSEISIDNIGQILLALNHFVGD